jgi:hypothetical protein
MAHTFEAYTFENGPLDKLLDKLIGSSREAIAWRNIRENVPLVKLDHKKALPGLAFGIRPAKYTPDPNLLPCFEVPG